MIKTELFKAEVEEQFVTPLSELTQMIRITKRAWIRIPGSKHLCVKSLKFTADLQWGRVYICSAICPTTHYISVRKSAHAQ